MAEEVPVSPAAGSTDGRFAAVEESLARAVRAGAFPGAAWAAGGASGTAGIGGVGVLDAASGRRSTGDSIYDLASLTKVIATTSVLMRLFEDGRFSLDTGVRTILPGFDGGGREKVTLEHLLTHSSGLPAWRALYQEARSREEALALVLATPLEGPPGEVERYSDLGAILLGECAARLGGLPLATLSYREVFGPLAMRDTCFRPPPSELRRIAPTELDRTFRRRLLHGEVHDENASILDGVAGHAGLFSTAEDLARFAREILRTVRGEGGPALWKTATARLFTARRGKVPGSSRALGWDTRSDGEDASGAAGSKSTSGRRFGPGSFGHTGFTGTSIWIDPARDRFAVLLSNHVHPDRSRPGMLEARRAFHDAVAGALDRAPATGKAPAAIPAGGGR
jgi:CubicO group peptidase (beta-lactamase class C family)